MQRIIVVGPSAEVARHFVIKHLALTPRLDGGSVILVWDDASWEKAVHEWPITPWIALPDSHEHVIKLAYATFGKPADRLPIETAPKDGRQILLIGPSGYVAPHDEHQETGHWRDDRDAWVDDTGERITDGYPAPTHWWPLG